MPSLDSDNSPFHSGLSHCNSLSVRGSCIVSIQNYLFFEDLLFSYYYEPFNTVVMLYTNHHVLIVSCDNRILLIVIHCSNYSTSIPSVSLQLRPQSFAPFASLAVYLCKIFRADHDLTVSQLFQTKRTSQRQNNK